MVLLSFERLILTQALHWSDPFINILKFARTQSKKHGHWTLAADTVNRHDTYFVCAFLCQSVLLLCIFNAYIVCTGHLQCLCRNIEIDYHDYSDFFILD